MPTPETPEPLKRIENIDQLHLRVNQGSAQAKAFLEQLEKQGFDTSANGSKEYAVNCINKEDPINAQASDRRIKERGIDAVEYRVKFNGRVWSLQKFKDGYGAKQKERMTQLHATGRTYRLDHKAENLGEQEVMPLEERQKLYAQDSAAAEAKRAAENDQKAADRLAATRRYYQQTPGAFRNWKPADRVKLMGNGVTEEDIDKGLKEGYFDITGSDARAKVDQMTRDGTIDRMVEEHMREAMSGEPIEGASPEAIASWERFNKQTEGLRSELQVVSDPRLREGLRQIYLHESGERLKGTQLNQVVSDVITRYQSLSEKEKLAVQNIVAEWPINALLNKLPGAKKLEKTQPKTESENSDRTVREKPMDTDGWTKERIASFLDSHEKMGGSKFKFKVALENAIHYEITTGTRGLWTEAMLSALKAAKPADRMDFFVYMQNLVKNEPTAEWQIAQASDKSDSFILTNEKTGQLLSFDKILTEPVFSVRVLTKEEKKPEDVAAKSKKKLQTKK